MTPIIYALLHLAAKNKMLNYEKSRNKKKDSSLIRILLRMKYIFRYAEMGEGDSSFLPQSGIHSE
jgi:hypothetical protein